MTFRLEITLGNDAMSSPEDVGPTLERIGREIRRYGFSEPGTHAPIRDANGNTVGRWELIDR